MAFFDLPLEKLREYKAEIFEKPDFDAFWERSLKEARALPLDPKFEPADFNIKSFDSFDVSFSGFGGHRIKGWFQYPKGAKEKLPCIVEFIGYGGGRGFPFEWLQWPSMGFAHLVMDTRGQGSVWRRGDTPDQEGPGSNPQHPGFMTRGILSPDTYYYRRLFIDAVRAVETVLANPVVDSNRIAVTGGSQGGGLSIAAAALAPDLVRACMPDVPYLCNIRRATQITDSFPYNEIVNYLKTQRDKKETVFDTLSYFDGVNLCARAKCPALFSVGLMDSICPPSTVFSAYNRYGNGNKEIVIYEYNNHEGGQAFQEIEKTRWLKGLWKL